MTWVTCPLIGAFSLPTCSQVLVELVVDPAVVVDPVVLLDIEERVELAEFFLFRFDAPTKTSPPDRSLPVDVCLLGAVFIIMAAAAINIAWFVCWSDGFILFIMLSRFDIDAGDGLADVLSTLLPIMLIRFRFLLPDFCIMSSMRSFFVPRT